MHKENNPLVLEISKVSDALKMSIFEQKDLALTIRHYSQILIKTAEINNLCQEIVLILNQADKKCALDNDALINLKKTGQVLWDHLLTRQVKEKLKNTTLSDLVLSLDEELINIPWELLFDGKEFLCLKFNLGRLVRTNEQAPALQYRSQGNSLRMLILANPTEDLKSAYQEGLQIKNQFDRKRKEISVDFKSTQIDSLYVKKNLRDYDIVHFAGHAELDPDDTKNSGWVLSDGKFSSQDILSLGESLALPSLIFSNACHSAQVSNNLMEKDYQEKNYSLASAFLFSGVRHYIGAIRRIEDTMSFAFAKEFYQQLTGGKSVGESMRQARLGLIKEHGMGAISWASYLLYGDAGFVMFGPRQNVQKIKKDRNFYKKLMLKFSLAFFTLSLASSLLLWLPTLNPKTYFLWQKSQKLYFTGKNQDVISLSRQIIKKDPNFLAIYPVLADTYRKLGDPQTALKYYFDYALLAERDHDKKALAAAYRGIGWTYHLFGEYAKAFDFYNKSISLSRENKDRLNEAAGLEKLAVWYIDKEEYETALGLLTKSSEINRERQYLRGYRYNLACDYFDIGLIFADKGDYASAKEFYKKSQHIFEKMKWNFELSDCYFNMGEIYLYNKEYLKALDYYLRGLSIDQMQGNLVNVASGYNMIGELYIEMDNAVEAEKYFNQSLAICEKINAPLELASVSENLGLLYKKQGKRNKARESLRQAQEIYLRFNLPAAGKVKRILLEENS